MSRVCEEFHCLPSEAIKELMNDPTNLALDIIELRAYAAAKHTVDTTPLSKLPKKDATIDRVLEIKYEIQKRRREGRG